MGLISRVSSRTYRFPVDNKIMAAAGVNIPRPDQKHLEVFQNSYKQLNEIQGEIAKHTQARQQLEAQLIENTTVEREVALCDRSAVMYKQVGPILVKQEYDEVKMNVKKRVDYIKKEMDRHEKQIEDKKKTQQEHMKQLRLIEDQLAKQMQGAGLIKKN